MTPRGQASPNGFALWPGAGLTIAVLVLIMYAPLAAGWFQQDDFILLHQARYEWSLSHPLGFFTISQNGLFTPLNNLLFWLEFQAFGLNQIGYRVVSVLLHFGNSLLVTYLAWLLTRRPATAMLAGVLFAVGFAKHEAVDWIAAYVHLVTAAFYLGSVICFLRWRQGGRRLDYGLSLLFFVLGWFSKEPIVSLPAAILLAALLLKEPRERADFRAVLPFFALEAVYLPAMYWWQKFGPGAVMIKQGVFGLNAHVFSNIESLAALVIPPPFSGINHFLARLPLPHLVAAYGALFLGGLFVFSVLLIWAYRRGPAVPRFCVLWILVTFLPFVFVSVGIGIRYLYLPSVGFAVLLAVLMQDVWARFGNTAARRGLLRAAFGAYLVLNMVPFYLWQGQMNANGRLRREVLQQIVAQHTNWQDGSTVCVDQIRHAAWDVNLALPVWIPNAPHFQPGDCDGVTGPTYQYSYVEGRLVPRPPVPAARASGRPDVP